MYVSCKKQTKKNQTNKKQQHIVPLSSTPCMPPIFILTYPTVLPYNTVRYGAVAADDGSLPNEHVLFQHAAVTKANIHPPVNVVFGMGVTLVLIISEVHLRSQRINPASDDVRAHSFVHQQVAYMSTILFCRYMHVDLVPQDLETGQDVSECSLMQGDRILHPSHPSPYLLIH